MKSKISFIKPLVYVVAIGIVGISAYYSVSNIAYYNKTGQLAAVVSGGYGDNPNLPVSDSESLTERIGVELISIFKDKVTFRQTGNPIGAQAFYEAIPRNSQDDIDRDDVVSEYRLVPGTLRLVDDPDLDSTFDAEFFVTHCQKNLDYKMLKTTEIKNGNFSFQIRPWILEWTRRVNINLKQQGIRPNISRGNNQFGLYGTAPYGNNNEDSINYRLGFIGECNLNRLHHNVYDKDAVDFRNEKERLFFLAKPQLAAVVNDVDDTIFEDLRKPYYVADYYINTRTPNNNALIEQKINKFLGSFEEAVGKNPGGSWLSRYNFESTIGRPLQVNVFVNSKLKRSYVYKISVASQSLVREVQESGN